MKTKADFPSSVNVLAVAGKFILFKCILLKTRY